MSRVDTVVRETMYNYLKDPNIPIKSECLNAIDLSFLQKKVKNAD